MQGKVKLSCTAKKLQHNKRAPHHSKALVLFFASECTCAWCAQQASAFYTYKDSVDITSRVVHLHDLQGASDVGKERRGDMPWKYLFSMTVWPVSHTAATATQMLGLASTCSKVGMGIMNSVLSGLASTPRTACVAWAAIGK